MYFLFYQKTLALSHQKFYPEISRCALQHQKILLVLH
jgi:hypothetical protein